MSEKIGVIKEQGDLGLFFDPITEAEEIQLKKADEDRKKDKETKDKRK